MTIPEPNWPVTTEEFLAEIGDYVDSRIGDTVTVPLIESAENPAVQVNPDAVWTWFGDPRAIVATMGGRRLLLVGVFNTSGESGITQYDLDTKTTKTVTAVTGLGVDDHNNPAVYQRADGYIEAYCSNHSGDTEYVAVSNTPYTVENGMTVVASDTLNVGYIPNAAGGHGYTYFTPWRMSSWGMDIGHFRGGGFTPTLAWRAGTTGGAWLGGKVYFVGPGGARPYVRSWGNGIDRLDVLVSSGHPDEQGAGTNHVYHFYIQGNSFTTANVYKSDGTIIRSLTSVVGNPDGTGATSPLTESEVTKIHDASTVTDGNGNGWTMSIGRDPAGRVAAAYMVFHQYSDTEYVYARLVGGTWQKHSLARFVPSIIPSLSNTNIPGQGYVPQVWVDQEDVDRILVTTPRDPTTRTNEIAGQFDAPNRSLQGNVVPVVDQDFSTAGGGWTSSAPGAGTVTTSARVAMPVGSTDATYNPLGASAFGWKYDYTKDATGTARAGGMIESATQSLQTRPPTSGRYTAVIDIYVETAATDTEARCPITFAKADGTSNGTGTNMVTTALSAGWNRWHSPVDVPDGTAYARLNPQIYTATNAGHVVAYFYKVRLVPGDAYPAGWVADTSAVGGSTDGGSGFFALPSASLTDALRPNGIADDELAYRVWYTKDANGLQRNFGIINEQTAARETPVIPGKRYTVISWIYIESGPTDLRFRIPMSLSRFDGSNPGVSAPSVVDPIFTGTGWHRYHSTIDVPAYTDPLLYGRLSPDFYTLTSGALVKAWIIHPMVVEGEFVDATHIERWTTQNLGVSFDDVKEIIPYDNGGKKFRPVIPRNRTTDAPDFVWVGGGKYDEYDNFGTKAYFTDVISHPATQYKLELGTVDEGPVAEATITGDPPTQTLDLTLPVPDDTTHVSIDASSGKAKLSQVPDTGGAPLTVFGHSLNYIGASNSNGVAARVAALLHTDLLMHAIGGQVMSVAGGLGIGLGAGGWDHVYRYTATANSTAEGKYAPRRGPILLWTGLNDLALAPAGSATTTLLKPLENALRASISRLQATSVYEENDATVTYPGGTYTRNAAGSLAPGSINFASGAFNESTSTNTKTISIAVPSDFPGGTIALGFLAEPTGQGSIWTFTVDGVGAGTIDTRNSGATVATFNYWVPVIKRLTSLSAGAHTIVATPSSISTATYFDGWWVEGATQPVAVPLQYYLPTGTSDADIDVLNTVISNVEAEFGANVFTIPTSDVVNKDATLTVDNTHLNDVGHGLMAERFYDYIQRALFTRKQQATTTAVVPGVSRWPNDATRNIIEPSLPSIAALTLRQSSQGYGVQSGDLLPIQDGTGAVLSGVGFGPAGKLKAMVGSNVRIAHGYTTSTHTGTRSGTGPAFTHNLSTAITADVIAGSLNLLQNCVVTAGGPLNADLIGRHVFNVTGGGGSAMVNGARITAVSGTTITLDKSFASGTTGGQYAIKPDIFFGQASIAGLFGVCVGGPADPSTVAQTAQQSAVGTWGDVNGAAPANPTTFNLYWVAIG